MSRIAARDRLESMKASMRGPLIAASRSTVEASQAISHADFLFMCRMSGTATCRRLAFRLPRSRHDSQASCLRPLASFLLPWFLSMCTPSPNQKIGDEQRQDRYNNRSPIKRIAVFIDAVNVAVKTLRGNQPLYSEHSRNIHDRQQKQKTNGLKRSAFVFDTEERSLIFRSNECNDSGDKAE